MVKRLKKLIALSSVLLILNVTIGCLRTDGESDTFYPSGGVSMEESDFGNSGGATGSIENICKDSCNQDLNCNPSEFEYFDSDDCIDECLYEMEEAMIYTSDECFNAIVSLYSCISVLSCAQLDDYWYESTPNYPCSQEEYKMYEHCEEGISSGSEEIEWSVDPSPPMVDTESVPDPW
jgi:hypothetical protein